jgi:uncharacterized protein (DUF488 family)
MALMHRQKLLLGLINKLNRNGILSRRAIVKSLFLLREEYNKGEKMKFYHFFPYKQGPFSQLCYSDLRKLRAMGFLDDNETQTLNLPEIEEDPDINHLLARFSSEKKITDYVYEKYPQYTIKSELVKHEPKTETGYFTIGYEGRDIDTFLNLLIQNNISHLIDVRENPFSMNFCFIRKTLSKFLNDVDISYTHIPELGIPGKDRAALNDRESYKDLFKRYRQGLAEKETHIQKIIQMGNKERIALMCFEKDVTLCHRGVLAQVLHDRSLEVRDI